MRQLNGEFGDKYRVGQLMPVHIEALRDAALARTAAQENQRAVGLRILREGMRRDVEAMAPEVRDLLHAEATKVVVISQERSVPVTPVTLQLAGDAVVGLRAAENAKRMKVTK